MNSCQAVASEVRLLVASWFVRSATRAPVTWETGLVLPSRPSLGCTSSAGSIGLDLTQGVVRL